RPGIKSRGMDADELWLEAYEGEALGEGLFRTLAQRATSPTEKAQLEALTLLEQATKELAAPVLERRGLPRRDAEQVEAGAKLADAAASMGLDGLLRSLPAATAKYQALYGQLAE